MCWPIAAGIDDTRGIPIADDYVFTPISCLIVSRASCLCSLSELVSGLHAILTKLVRSCTATEQCLSPGLLYALLSSGSERLVAIATQSNLPQLFVTESHLQHPTPGRWFTCMLHAIRGYVDTSFPCLRFDGWTKTVFSAAQMKDKCNANERMARHCLDLVLGAANVTNIADRSLQELFQTERLILDAAQFLHALHAASETCYQPHPSMMPYALRRVWSGPIADHTLRRLELLEDGFFTFLSHSSLKRKQHPTLLQYASESFRLRLIDTELCLSRAVYRCLTHLSDWSPSRDILSWNRDLLRRCINQTSADSCCWSVCKQWAILPDGDGGGDGPVEVLWTPLHGLFSLPLREFRKSSLHSVADLLLLVENFRLSLVQSALCMCPPDQLLNMSHLLAACLLRVDSGMQQNGQDPSGDCPSTIGRSMLYQLNCVDCYQNGSGGGGSLSTTSSCSTPPNDVGSEEHALWRLQLRRLCKVPGRVEHISTEALLRAAGSTVLRDVPLGLSYAWAAMDCSKLADRMKLFHQVANVIRDQYNPLNQTSAHRAYTVLLLSTYLSADELDGLRKQKCVPDGSELFSRYIAAIDEHKLPFDTDNALLLDHLETALKVCLHRRLALEFPTQLDISRLEEETYVRSLIEQLSCTNLSLAARLAVRYGLPLDRAVFGRIEFFFNQSTGVELDPQLKQLFQWINNSPREAEFVAWSQATVYPILRHLDLTALFFELCSTEYIIDGVSIRGHRQFIHSLGILPDATQPLVSAMGYAKLIASLRQSAHLPPWQDHPLYPYLTSETLVSTLADALDQLRRCGNGQDLSVLFIQPGDLYSMWGVRVIRGIILDDGTDEGYNETSSLVQLLDHISGPVGDDVEAEAEAIHRLADWLEYVSYGQWSRGLSGSHRQVIFLSAVQSLER